MGSIIWKPQPQNPGKGPVFLIDSNRHGNQGAPTVNVNGQSYTGKYLNTENGVNQYEFPRELIGMQNLQFTYGDQTGTINSGGQSYEGDSLSAWQPRAKGSVGYQGAGGQPNFTPGTTGGYGMYPAYMGGGFPTANLATFNPIAGAQYQFTDPMKFAKEYGEFNRGEYQKNMALSKGMALDQIDTELQGLQHYAPAAAALKREQTSIDNQFNQQQRTSQLNQAMPGAIGSLRDQASRAATYASGGIPDALQDRALEMGVRSRAADMSAAGGFGAGSSVSRKASDLMSAEQRLQIAQYGEQLTGTNLQQQQQLLLAPTEYSNAGQQIDVNPKVSAAQLQSQNQTQLNAETMMSTTNALSSTVQQNQYSAGLQQQTQQFNAQGDYNASLANAGILNNFAMGKFNYDVGYAGTVAGAAQTDVNTSMALLQQAQARDQANSTASDAQTANTINAGVSALGTVAGFLKGAGVFGDGGNSGDTSSLPSSSDILGPDSMLSGETPDFSIDAGYGDGPPSMIESGVPDFDMAYNSGGGSGDYSLGSPSYDDMLSSTEFQTYASQVPVDTARSLIGSASARGYATDMGLSSADTMQLALKPSSDTVANGILANAGVVASGSPVAGGVPIGSNYQGVPMYANSKMQSIQDSSPGVSSVGNLGSFIGSLGVSSVDQAQFQTLEKTVSDPTLHSDLDAAASTGNIKQFVQSTQTATNTMGIAATGLAAYKIAQAWPKMSTGQKSLALASIGLQGIKSVYGSMDKTPVPISARDGYKPLSVSNAMAIAGAGLNAAEVALNWGDLNNARRITGGARTVTDIAKLGEEMGLISKTGEVAQAVPYVNLAAGAYNLYTNWPKMGTEQKAVAAAGITQAGATLAGAAIPGLNVALAAYQGYQVSKAGYDKYYAGGTTNQKRGYAGALAAGGLMSGAMGITGMALGIGAVSMVSGLVGGSKSGKGQNQMIRDSFRSTYKQSGLINDNYEVTMADGSTANMGVDGKGGMHTARDAAKMVGDKPDANMRAYDTDYTNDLDYASGMAGTTMSRLLSGGRNEHVDRMGSQWGNAFLGSVGFGKDMTPESFATVMGNARGMYAKAGITSKEDALKLVAKAAHEKRLTAADQAASMQTINMMYDKDGYDQASSLMKGRWVGVQNMQGAPERSPTISTGLERSPQGVAVKVASSAIQGSQSSKSVNLGESAAKVAGAAKGMTATEAATAGVRNFPRTINRSNMFKSKEDIKQANLRMFG